MAGRGHHPRTRRGPAARHQRPVGAARLRQRRGRRRVVLEARLHAGGHRARRLPDRHRPRRCGTLARRPRRGGRLLPHGLRPRARTGRGVRRAARPVAQPCPPASSRGPADGAQRGGDRTRTEPSHRGHAGGVRVRRRASGRACPALARCGPDGGAGQLLRRPRGALRAGSRAARRTYVPTTCSTTASGTASCCTPTPTCCPRASTSRCSSGAVGTTATAVPTPTCGWRPSGKPLPLSRRRTARDPPSARPRPPRSCR